MRLREVKDGTRVRVWRGGGSNFAMKDEGHGSIVGTIFQSGSFIAWKEGEITTPLTCPTFSDMPGFTVGAYIMQSAECFLIDVNACPQCGLIH